MARKYRSKPVEVEAERIVVDEVTPITRPDGQQLIFRAGDYKVWIPDGGGNIHIAVIEAQAFEARFELVPDQEQARSPPPPPKLIVAP